MKTTLKKRLRLLLNKNLKIIITNIIASLFILLFIYTATSKLYTFKDFDHVLQLIPVFGPFHFILAILIISLNIIIGVLLIIPATQKIGLYAALVLLIIFTLFLFYMVYFEKNLPCSCGGITANLTWRQHIWLNMILTTLAFSGILPNQYKNQ